MLNIPHVLLIGIFSSACGCGRFFRHQTECSPPPGPTDGLNSSELVDYYVNLVDNNIAEALVYELPTSNSYFLEGSGNPNVTKEYGTFDFIVVGAGTAGGTLASMLSENNRWDILLLEAGGNQTDFSDIPAMALYLESSPLNWGYYSTQQANCCLGMVDQKCNYPRGKAIGGTGDINVLMYVRGNKGDYDHWASLGNPGWSYADLLPIFKAQENSQIPDGDPLYQGKGGPINVEYSYPTNKLLYNFIQANIDVGRNYVDYNGPEQLGVSHTQYFTKHGKRESSGRVFIDKVYCRKNLHILREAYATKILINKEKEAQGVIFYKNGQKYVARAKKDVIISGGSVNTPQLLLLSGIGPRAELEKLGIDVVNDVPAVGKHLQDHPAFFGLSFSTNYTMYTATTEQSVEWYLKGLGPFTDPGNSDGIAFMRFNDSKLPEGVPDIQLIYVPPNSTNNYTPKMLNTVESINQSYWSKIETQHTFRIYAVLLHEESRGSITLKSVDPFDFPNIDLNFLSKESDIEALYKAILLIFQFIGTEPFQKVNATYIPTNIPQCDAFEHFSKDYWYCNLRQLTATMYHPTSTARMLPENNPEGVVDHRLNVRGIKNLRVADCSIIPYIISGNTNAIAFVIGQKAAQILKEDYYVENGLGSIF